MKDELGNPVADGTNVTMSHRQPTRPGRPTQDGTVTPADVRWARDVLGPDDRRRRAPGTRCMRTRPGRSPRTAPSSRSRTPTAVVPTDCTATFPNGTSTVSAPAGTVLIIETNQLTCDNVGDNFLAGTVKIVPPPGPDAIDVTFQDFFGPDAFASGEFPGSIPLLQDLGRSRYAGRDSSRRPALQPGRRGRPVRDGDDRVHGPEYGDAHLGAAHGLERPAREALIRLVGAAGRKPGGSDELTPAPGAARRRPATMPSRSSSSSRSRRISSVGPSVGQARSEGAPRGRTRRRGRPRGRAPPRGSPEAWLRPRPGSLPCASA